VEAYGFRANRVEKMRVFAELVDHYCDGNEAEAERVRTKTAEEFYMWIERKIKRAKKMMKEIGKVESKT
jgi:hypothetical protein